MVDQALVPAVDDLAEARRQQAELVVAGRPELEGRRAGGRVEKGRVLDSVHDGIAGPWCRRLRVQDSARTPLACGWETGQPNLAALQIYGKRL